MPDASDTAEGDVRYALAWIARDGSPGCVEVESQAQVQAIARQRAFEGCRVWAAKQVCTGGRYWVEAAYYDHEALVGVPYRRLGDCN